MDFRTITDAPIEQPGAHLRVVDGNHRVRALCAVVELPKAPTTPERRWWKRLVGRRTR